MPRTARASVGGVCYHVINRGNARRQVFWKDGDYQAFLKALAHACIEIPMPVLAYCIMPNHFHLVVRPVHDGDLSRWMHWLPTRMCAATTGIIIAAATSGKAVSRHPLSRKTIIC